MSQHKNIEGIANGTIPIKELFANIADELNGRLWPLKITLQFLPGLWSPIILNRFSEQLITNNTGELNAWGWGIAIVIYGASFLITLLTAYKSSRDEKRKKYNESRITALKAEITLRQSVTTAENTVERKRVRRIKENAYSVVKRMPSFAKVITSAFNPREHISAILDELRTCFARVTDLTKENIHISAAYCIDGKEWAWLVSLANEDVASIEELLKNKSAFRVVIDKQSFFYCNDKRKAAQEDKYFFDARDHSKSNKGSIICWRIASSHKDAPNIQMIISISTYGRSFIENEDIAQDVIDRFYNDRIRDIILQQFENELVESLLLFQLSLIDKLPK